MLFESLESGESIVKRSKTYAPESTKAYLGELRACLLLNINCGESHVESL
jgi:hypothetical protein